MPVARFQPTTAASPAASRPPAGSPHRIAAAALALSAALAGAAASPAAANDTSAAFGIGGLQFLRNDAVEMRSEDLYVSPAEIRVRYVFFNTSDKDVTNLVAFPLPPIGPLRDDENIAYPDEEAGGHAVDFHTTVDGVAVETSVEEKAVAMGVDRTAWLRKLDLPLAGHTRAARDALDALPREEWDALLSVGLATSQEWDQGDGMRAHLSPMWSYQATYYWPQTFRAGAETVVEHRYRPAVGLSQGTSLGDAGKPDIDQWQKQAIAQMTKDYCIDKPFLAAAQKADKAQRAVNAYDYLKELRIDYILTTGANWLGPIDTFRLVVDKVAPGNLVSFCGDGIRKIGPTTFEMTKTDFFPTGDLKVLVLSKDFSALGADTP